MHVCYLLNHCFKVMTETLNICIDFFFWKFMTGAYNSKTINSIAKIRTWFKISPVIIMWHC
jgi:L-ascorbate metabolism protein UlaG (beta-lactamase superfamily)